MTACARWVLAGLLFTLGLLAATPAMAQDDAASAASEAEPPKPLTTRNIDIPVAELALRVKPLTAEELAVEADGWMRLLRAKALAIAAAQVVVFRTNEAMSEAENADAARAAEIVRQAAEGVKAIEAQLRAQEAEAGVGVEAPVPDAAAQEAGEPMSPAEVAQAADRVAEEAEQAVAEGPEAVEAVVADVKQAVLDRVTALRNEQAALVDRLNVVLDSWEAKGGDVTAQRQYVHAVSGLSVDVSDASALWATVRGWVVSTEGGLRWLFNFIKFFAVVVVTWLAARLFAWLFHKAMARAVGKMSRLAERAIIRSFKMLIWVVGLVVALSMLQVDITPMIAAIGAAGLVIGLALQGTLSNIASGVMILINRPFDVDDIVSAAGITGKVAEMTLVTTIFRTLDNQTVVVPNNEIWGQVITNITANDTRRVDMTFGVSYDDDLDLAERLIREVVEAHELVLDDPEPVIKVFQLGDSSVNFICRPWAKTTDYWTVLWDVTREVKRRFDAEGVTIPFPQRDVHIYHQQLEAAAAPTPQPEAERASDAG